jgi:hypothetical protein
MDHDVELTTEARSGPPRRRLGLLAVNLAVIAAALVGVYVLAADRADEETGPPETSVAPTSSVEEPTVERLLEVMPASPIDGKQSQRLPVAALPRAELADGQTITAIGKGFAPGERVGAVLCVAEAALEGVAACDLGSSGGFGHVTYAEAAPDGSVQVAVRLRASIVTPFSGPVDCRSAPERCLVAIGAVSDYDRSGGAPIGFAGQPPFPAPAAAVSVPGPYQPDQVVDVVVTGMLSPRELQVELCRGEQCVALARGRVAPDGTFVAPVALPWSFLTRDGGVVECDVDCELRVVYLALADSSDAPVPAPVAAPFGPVDPAAAPPPEPVATTAPPTAPPTAVPIVGSPYPQVPAPSVPPSTAPPGPHSTLPPILDPTPTTMLAGS